MTEVDLNPSYWREYGPFQKVKHDLIRHYLGGWFPKLGTWGGDWRTIDGPPEERIQRRLPF